MSIVVFDIGGSSVKYGSWQGDVLVGKGSFETPKSWDAMKNEMKSVFDGFAATDSIEGVAISSPGAVDSVAGIIGGISAVPYLHRFPIKAEWENLFGVPVSVENDANCAALAEVWLGAAKDVQHALFIVIGSGIGGAVIVNRQLFKGKNLFGGEFGYMLLDGENTLSRLGSPVQVAERYGKAMGLPDGVADGKYLFERATEGEPLAVQFVDGMIDALARGIYNLSVSFNPDRVIIGGGVSVREDLIARIRERTAYHLNEHGAEAVDPDIQVCAFRNDANLIGAVAHFRQTAG
ncbi:ROK family protein [Trichococcus ilyis]|uniref:Sugar kinase of the NBD/HSP70 family, may contain an N-terminal HTH domain n=1 Tax=Trichococcus ilyis TaxID=640938 RepID=A0A143YIN6_9LACT|nr:ROK family protein [Trichococcus ilyis]CZQ87971.1 Hypothetical protein TR210_656 [Trichococcus ilyis]SEI67008.1 Sugar kinase of the NBD/HSP70 family, may contain an N-terminal HTH domain [Trichococcus ilyis]